jgi:hypothetical protein
MPHTGAVDDEESPVRGNSLIRKRRSGKMPHNRKDLLLLIIACLSIFLTYATYAHADPLVVEVKDSGGRAVATLETNEMGFTAHVGKSCIELRTDDDQDLIWALDEFGNPTRGARKALWGFSLIDVGGDALKGIRPEGSSWVCEMANGQSLGIVACREQSTEIFDGNGKLMGTAQSAGARVAIRGPGGSVLFRISGLDYLRASLWFLNGHGRDPVGESICLAALVHWGTRQ